MSELYPRLVAAHGILIVTPVYWYQAPAVLKLGSAALSRYIGYFETYARSHEALDSDVAFQEEVRNAARALAQAVRFVRKADSPRLRI